MSFSETLADRVREIIAVTHSNVEEKKMFGGICFMVNDKMCVGVRPGKLMVRFDPAIEEEVMEKEGYMPMDFTKKVMKGFAYVDIDALGTKKKLGYWIKLALNYNELAKPSKKKKRAST
jgi:TfoX/Sxy family transcriptional regulator of competence genes